jgi:transmembrane sensor
MEDNRQTFWEKLARDVSGNASEEDKTWLRQQKQQHQDSEEEAEQAEKVWKGAAMPRNAYEPDVENGWQRFRMKVQARQTEIPKPAITPKKNNFMWAVAATVSLLLVAGWYFI